MATNFSSGNLQFEVGFGPGKMPARDPEASFHLAVLGDFSGRAGQDRLEPVDQRRAWRVDCDNLPQSFAKLKPQLRLPDGDHAGSSLSLSFTQIDDFHPDQLLKQTPSLAALAALGHRLLNPATAPAAAAELQARLTRPATASPEASGSTPTASESDSETMARLLGGAPARAPAAPATLPPGIERLLKEAVKTSVVAGATPQQAALLSALELELTTRLRTLLHQPGFQALEAAWRGLDLLVRNFGAEENLKLWLVDVSKEELAADLQRQDALADTGTWRLLQLQAEEHPWTLWLGLYTFDADSADVELLGRLAKVAAGARAPFIGGASPHLAECEALHHQPDPRDWQRSMPAGVRENWQALRARPEAAWVSLALPRFLARQPYGKQDEPIETFAFEELAPDSSREALLWGNPAILCGYVAAAAFQAEGWAMEGVCGEVGSLPVHTFEEAGEKVATPCAEAWLGDRAGDALIQRGLVPVLSVKGSDAVQIPALPSLAGSALAFSRPG